MGLFNRRKNNPVESYFANILEERKRLEISPNYQMSCNYLKHAFFSDAVTVEEIWDNPEIMRKLIAVALLVGTENGIRFPDNYQSLSYTFIKSPTRNSYGYIVGFEDPKRECECNFVALMVIGGEKRYFTSELYISTNSFSLCEFSPKGHISYVNVTNSFEEFKAAIIERIL